MALDELRKRPKKEDATVITARLKNSRYNWLKSYCEELGISINEAINFMVDGEYKIWLKKNSQGNTAEIQQMQEDPNQVTIDDVINNDVDDESKVNTEVNNVNTAEMNTKTIQPKIISAKKNTSKVNWVQYDIDGKVPCPICGEWDDRTNILRHLKQKHSTDSKVVHAEHSDKMKEMFTKKKEELKP